jgi:hypothetical protein
MKPFEVFLVVVLILCVVSVVVIFASVLSRKSKNNKILAEYFENKIETFKVIKNKSTKKLTEILFSSKH